MHGTSDTALTGKCALVTGGTRGIGAAIVHRLSSAGATVVTTARSTPQGLPQLALFVAADLSTAAGVEQVVRAVRENETGSHACLACNPKRAARKRGLCAQCLMPRMA